MMIAKQFTCNMEGINKYAPLVALKTQAIEYANNIKDLKVTDDNSEAIVNQRLSEAKALLNAIEKKRTELKAPYLDAGREIDNIAKQLTEDLNKAFSDIKEELRLYKVKKEEERQKELQRLQKIQAEIDNRKTLALAAIAKAETKSDLSAIFVEHVKNFPQDLLSGEFKQDCELVLNAIKSAGSNRLKQIVEGIKPVATEEIIPVETAPEVAPSKLTEAIASAEATKTTGLRKTWKFELSDIFKVPAAWLKIDEEKVKEWMKIAIENGNLNDGDVKVINGVKFYQSTGVVIKS